MVSFYVDYMAWNWIGKGQVNKAWIPDDEQYSQAGSAFSSWNSKDVVEGSCRQ